MEELDAQFGISDIFETDKREKLKEKYTDKDLRGLTVQHDIESFAEERDVILTLKDKGVLDEDGDDVLVNVNMLDDERYKKVNINKKNYSFQLLKVMLFQFQELIFHIYLITLLGRN